MRKRAVFALLILYNLLGFSQNDPQATTLLSQVTKKAESYKTMKAVFVIHTIDLQEKTEGQDQGTLFIKGDKYRLQLPEMETFFDGKSVWTYMADVKEVNVTNPGKGDDFIFTNPKQLFSFYENDFKSFYIGESEIKGTNLQEVELVPKDLGKEYSKIKLWIDDNKQQVNSIRFYGKSGIHYLIEIESFETGIPLADDFFIFDPKKHPEVEVIDMR
jgi:outer membrane lipoprotein-sorting protein